MTDPNPDRPDPTPDGDAFVREVAGLYTPPEMSAARRSAFDARLGERLSHRRRWSWGPVLAGTAAVLALALLLLRTGEDPRPGEGPARLTAQRPEPRPARIETTAEEAILALATASAAPAEKELPDDYEAIENLFLDG
jgi:hypothetical protein